MALTLRNVKGSRLTFTELDGNFIYLQGLDIVSANFNPGAALLTLTTYSGHTITANIPTTYFSGNTSGSCINDLFVRTISGCTGAVTIGTSIQSPTSTVSGDYSVAYGQSTLATGTTSHAEGSYTEAHGDSAHAEGRTAKAYGDFSHAEGRLTLASGEDSHAEGHLTQATGATSHAEGTETKACGAHSHAEGYQTTATGTYSHAEGYGTTAGGEYSHAEGRFGVASNHYAHVEGNASVASAIGSHAEGDGTTASGGYSHAEGKDTTASGHYSHAEGNTTNATGDYSHAGGNTSVATGTTSFIHSTNSYVYGERSAVLGGQNITGRTADTVYVPNLNIDSTPSNDNALTQILARDTDGTVKYRAASSLGGGGGTFTGNTSGTCIEDIWVTNIQSCSPLNINPGDEGNVYFGSSSGVTINVADERVGIGTAGSTNYKLWIKEATTHAQGKIESDNSYARWIIDSHDTHKSILQFNEANDRRWQIAADGSDDSLKILRQDITTGGTIYPAIVIDTNDYVGIGTQIPDELLHVSGTSSTQIKITGGLNAGLIIDGAENSFVEYKEDASRKWIVGNHQSDDHFKWATGTTFNSDTVMELSRAGGLTVHNFQMLSGATDGYVLTSDVSGKARWEVSSGGGGATIDPYNNVGNTNEVYWDVSGTSTNYEITLTGNTILVMSNVRNGDYGTMIAHQDVTGSRTLTFSVGTNYVVNGGGGAPTLTATGGATDILSFTYNGTAFYWTVGNDYT